VLRVYTLGLTVIPAKEANGVYCGTDEWIYIFIG
jgi:hypothetical protein